MHYASIHMTSQNDSETELSIEQQELGNVFKKAFRFFRFSFYVYILFVVWFIFVVLDCGMVYTDVFLFLRSLGVTVLKLPADHDNDVIFPSETSSFNESFIQEENGAMTLPASLFVARGNVKLFKLCNSIVFNYLFD